MIVMESPLDFFHMLERRDNYSIQPKLLNIPVLDDLKAAVITDISIVNNADYITKLRHKVCQKHLGVVTIAVDGDFFVGVHKRFEDFSD